VDVVATPHEPKGFAGRTEAEFDLRTHGHELNMRSEHVDDEVVALVAC
jgi:hypothetical protein